MQKQQKMASIILLVLLARYESASAAPAAAAKVKTAAVEKLPVKREKVLWQDPADIESRDLFFGEGGRGHQPGATGFEFIKEDLQATNPKFTVRDGSGAKWKIKLGEEARPETAATRLVWAVGFHTDEDYFLPEVQVSGLPAMVHRGKRFITPDGTMHGARLERETEGEKKAGVWKWKEAPFAGTREWNGLRVMMALINNWDLKDVNNTVYEKQSKNATRLVYVVSDLGATFGPDHLLLGDRKKGDLKTFSRTTFIRHTKSETVDFASPGAPPPIMIFSPQEYFQRIHLLWLGHNIPRQDAHWMGTVLARLSPRQIRDAFRAGGYSAEETEAYAAIMERRIAALVAL